MEAIERHRICPVEMAGMLTSPLRRLTVNPGKLLKPYIEPGMSCLDFGCGPGFFSIPMALLTGEEGRVTAADVQPGMLELLRFRTDILYPGYPELQRIIRYHESDGVLTGLADWFDFILLFHVFHEVPDRKLLAGDLRGRLKPGGVMLLAEPMGHVPLPEWQESLSILQQAGLEAFPGPKLTFSRSALLRRRV